MAADLPILCEREIVSLHQFFVDWRAGTLPRSRDAFDRLARVIHDQFYIVAPDASVTDRPTLLAALESGHGTNVAFEIEIRNVTLRQSWEGHCLTTYEEWQEIRGQQTARLSTVLFSAAPSLPESVQWLAVHETWLPGQTPA